MRYVLDSNIAIAALNGVNAVRSRLMDVPRSEVGIPIVGIAELTFGAYKSRRREANIERIAALRRSVTVLDLGDRVADLYGSTRAALEARGTPEETKASMQAAIDMHVQGLREDRLPIPEPSAIAEYVEVGP